jgi:hypothetical protein
VRKQLSSCDVHVPQLFPPPAYIYELRCHGQSVDLACRFGVCQIEDVASGFRAAGTLLRCAPAYQRKQQYGEKTDAHILPNDKLSNAAPSGQAH